MGKTYKGKTCVYCAADGASTTADHVFARQFFPVSQRQGLPIVPACEACNQAKSTIEHYLASVLPFASNHPDASAMLENEVPRRLAHNLKLRRELAAGYEKIVVNEGGQVVETLAIPIDSSRLAALFAYIAKGLAAYHWGVVIPAAHKVAPVILNPFYEPQFRALFLLRARQRINGSVGNGAFLYQGAQAIDDPALTMWRFQALGGVVMAGDERVPEAGDYTIWVTTGRDIEAWE